VSIKILCFAAIAATVATFSIGSASASVLCTTEPALGDGACTGSIYPKNTNISASLVGEAVVFATTSGTIECTASKMTGKVTVSAGGGPGVAVVGEITSWIFGETSEEANNCNREGEACTVSNGLNVPYENTISHFPWTKGDGHFEVRASSGSGNPGMIVKCGTAIDCIFSMSSISFWLTGGAPAIFEKERWMEQEGKTCPQEVKLIATYKVIPSPMFVTNE
jgi:hypothetical protein